MKDLTVYHRDNLPAEPVELSKFIILAQEKIQAVKAEIRAIKRLEMAKEVYDQKLEEMKELQAVTLLAYQRMGELTRKMPKAQGTRTDKELLRASAKKFETAEKPKAEVLQEIGLSKDQVSRMEQLAANPDIVAEVIEEAQTGEIEATQTEVLRRIKQKKSNVVQFEPPEQTETSEEPDGGAIVVDIIEAEERANRREFEKIDADYDNLEIFHEALESVLSWELSDDVLDSVIRVEPDFSGTMQDIDDVIEKMTQIKSKLILGRAKNGKKNKS